MPTIESEQADLVLSLRVILFPDGDQWGAQGLELDYMTAGESPEKAKANFSRGLAATVRENLRVFGSLDKMLRVAPQECWDEWLSNRYALDRAEAPPACRAEDGFPFRGIAYLEPLPAV